MISEYEVRNSCQGNVCVGEIYDAPPEKYQENLESGNLVIQHILKTPFPQRTLAGVSFSSNYPNM